MRREPAHPRGMGASPMQPAAPAALCVSSEAAGRRECMGEAPMPREAHLPHLRRRGMLPLWGAIVLACLMLAALVWLTVSQTSTRAADGRTEIVAWGIT